MRFKFLVLVLCLIIKGYSQEGEIVKIRTIAFYNVENLFDIENDSLTFDDDRTPEGKDGWTNTRYSKKIENTSKVLSQIGANASKSSPDIIGLCEVENKGVIVDLINHSNLEHLNYGIVHFDSPDERGIDVALIYKNSAFTPTSFQSRRLLLQNNEGFRDYTRDQLVVGGLLDEEQIYFIVNHWPSRSGGKARSEPYRLAAAKLNKRIFDSIQRIDLNAKIISMGDFNDDPLDDSFKKVLKSTGKKNDLEPTSIFNPMVKLYKKGIGSLAYRDKWNLFDQIYFTANLVEKNSTSYYFWKARVFAPSYLITRKGKYKGYPFRTYSGGSYTAGYSDHFPVYIYLIKKNVE